VRRSPKALERERRIEQLIVEANAARKPSDGDQELRALVEDPAFQENAPVSRCVLRSASPQALGAQRSSERGSGFVDDPTYNGLVARIGRRNREQEGTAVAEFLAKLFTTISRVNAKGPLQPDDIDLPDPPSSYRLQFEPNGNGSIKASPLRVRVQEIYDLLTGLDLSRIRECSGCDERKLFWARRDDQVGCGKPCANRIRVRNFYRKNKPN
jgi:hypothetical protein